MKRIVPLGFLSLLLFSTFPARAQDRTRAGKVSTKTVNISGTVGSEGKTLVSDKGNRVWKVVNSDLLATTAGQHVLIKAYVNSQANEITVSVVRLQEVRTTPKLDDVAFRR